MRKMTRTQNKGLAYAPRIPDRNLGIWRRHSILKDRVSDAPRTINSLKTWHRAKAAHPPINLQTRDVCFLDKGQVWVIYSRILQPHGSGSLFASLPPFFPLFFFILSVSLSSSLFSSGIFLLSLSCPGSFSFPESTQANTSSGHTTFSHRCKAHQDRLCTHETCGA